MRVIPGMVVASPSDDIEAKAMVAAAYEHQGPVYMRFGRLAVPVINDRRIINLSLVRASFSAREKILPSSQTDFALHRLLKQLRSLQQTESMQK